MLDVQREESEMVIIGQAAKDDYEVLNDSN